MFDVHFLGNPSASDETIQGQRFFFDQTGLLLWPAAGLASLSAGKNLQQPLFNLGSHPRGPDDHDRNT